MYEHVCVCVYIYMSFWILNYMQKKLGLTETEWYLLEVRRLKDIILTC